MNFGEIMRQVYALQKSGLSEKEIATVLYSRQKGEHITVEADTNSFANIFGKLLGKQLGKIITIPFKL